jgi:formimidoylglutamate deiminase
LQERGVLKFAAGDAMLPEGWAQNVVFTIGDDGVIVAIEPDADGNGLERAAGPVVPAMPNVHSHAFQRAIAGRTGRSSPAHDDSFWTWRQAMYAFLDRLDADALEAIAAQAYVEMAKSGYASVAEFHYVHHDAAGKPFQDPAELAWRIVAAARTAGLGLTLLPVFYAHAGFGGVPATAGQRRFVHTTYTFTQLVERLQQGREAHGYVLGVAPHSLRAVTPDEMGQVVRLAAPGAPVHIHAAEQTREVDDCYAWSQLRPVEWLLGHASVDARWCIVHATHMTEREVAALATSGAVVGLAPTTEADLGDGTFPGHAYLAAGGRFGVGSDSNTIVDPFAELRQLEWSQRMRARRRNVLGTPGDWTVGAALWAKAARGGAQGLAQPVGALEAGQRADIVVLNVADPALTGQAADDVLDAAIFGPCRAPVRDVMARGKWIVRDGHHVAEAGVLARYRATLARIDASQ